MTDTLPTAAEYEALADRLEQNADNLDLPGSKIAAQAAISSASCMREAAQALRAAAGGGVTMPPAREFGFVVIVPERVSMRDDIRVVIHGHEHRLGFQRDDGAYELLPLNIPHAPSKDMSAAEMREAAANAISDRRKHLHYQHEVLDIGREDTVYNICEDLVRAIPLTRGSI